MTLESFEEELRNEQGSVRTDDIEQSVGKISIYILNDFD